MSAKCPLVISILMVHSLYKQLTERRVFSLNKQIGFMVSYNIAEGMFIKIEIMQKKYLNFTLIFHKHPFKRSFDVGISLSLFSKLTTKRITFFCNYSFDERLLI